MGPAKGEFDALVERRHLPYWCTDWMVHTDPQHGKKIQDCFDQFLPPFSLVEIEVRNDGDEMTGKALLSIVERKVVNGHFSASVNMLSSTDPLFLDWGNLHLQESFKQVLFQTKVKDTWLVPCVGFQDRHNADCLPYGVDGRRSNQQLQ